MIQNSLAIPFKSKKNKACKNLFIVKEEHDGVIMMNVYTTYEEAFDDAIKYCLENLI